MTASARALSGSESPVMTVSELSQSLKRTVEQQYNVVRVRGEISGFKVHTSGHAYLALKDQDAVLDAVIWRGTSLGVKMEEGLEVTVLGRITTFPGRSKYQMVIQYAEAAGIGALLKLLEDRKIKLAAEGLFARKRPLPEFPKVIGVVTSATGAVIKDILHRLEERYPCRVILWPVAVQGQGAAEQIAAAINGFQTLSERPDVLIVARGGGSIEDLWAFNEEIVVRAAAASGIPLISAVGHETDTTLIDYASDRRAPTPTAAAEIATPHRSNLSATVDTLFLRLKQGTDKHFERLDVTIEHLKARLPDTSRWLEPQEQKLDDRGERLTGSMGQYLRGREDRVGSMRLPALLPYLEAMETKLAAQDICNTYAGYLNNLQNSLDMRQALLNQGSFAKILERGFAMVSSQGRPVLSCSSFKPGDTKDMDIRFHDGVVSVQAQVKAAG